MHLPSCTVTNDFKKEPVLDDFIGRCQLAIQHELDPNVSFPSLSGRDVISQPFYGAESAIISAWSVINGGWKMFECSTHQNVNVSLTLSCFKHGEVDVLYLPVHFPKDYEVFIKVLRETIGKFGNFIPPAYGPKWFPHIPIAKGYGLEEKLKHLPKDKKLHGQKTFNLVLPENKPQLIRKVVIDGKKNWEEISF